MLVTSVFWALEATLVLVACMFFARATARVFREGGRIVPNVFSWVDVILAIALILLLGGLAGATLWTPADTTAKLTADKVLPATLMVAALPALLIVVLTARGIALGRVTGARAQSPLRTLGWTLLWFAASLPVLFSIALLSKLLLPAEQGEQEMVVLFRETVRGGNGVEIWSMVLAAAVIAPLAEEFLFRGYFYPVLKRNLGGIGAGFLSATIFAAFHVNLASLAALFVLALCLTLAYEATGSLLVPMGMHALFNGANLFMMYGAERGFFTLPS